jgi:hypothetical protein
MSLSLKDYSIFRAKLIEFTNPQPNKLIFWPVGGAYTSEVFAIGTEKSRR